MDITVQEPLTKGDLLNLHRIRIEATVTSLDGLEYAENLETIFLDTKEIRDYSSLYNLKKLKNINIGLLLEGLDLTFLGKLNHVKSFIHENKKERGDSVFAPLRSAQSRGPLDLVRPSTLLRSVS